MLGHVSAELWKAEHLTFRVVGLDQPVTVEEDADALQSTISFSS